VECSEIPPQQIIFVGAYRANKRNEIQGSFPFDFAQGQDDDIKKEEDVKETRAVRMTT
jgi:hypothetical protein